MQTSPAHFVADQPHASEIWDAAQRARFNSLLACPVDGSPLRWEAGSEQFISEGGRQYGMQNGLPSFFVPNEPNDTRDVTDIVKAFYEETPFPNYDGLDDRGSLKMKASAGIFGKLLDEQIPEGASVLEAGCGTGQLTNFLGMGRGRMCVGGDICLNSLTLAKGFRDRFSINNANFVQMNLFRPPFRDGAFDVVISNGVLHHTGDPEGGYRSILRKLKPGGFVAIGLYNYFGRLPTLWRRALIEKFGDRAEVLDRRLRRGNLAEGRHAAWFRDQYKHPHESRHSIDEVLGWFDKTGVEFLSCIPTVGDTEFDSDFRLFEPHSKGTYAARLSTQLDMLLTGGADGALYIMIGRKK